MVAYRFFDLSLFVCLTYFTHELNIPAYLHTFMSSFAHLPY